MSKSVKGVVFDLGNTLWFEAMTPPRGEIDALQAARIRPLVAAWGFASRAPSRTSRGTCGTPTAIAGTAKCDGAPCAIRRCSQ